LPFPVEVVVPVAVVVVVVVLAVVAVAVPGLVLLDVGVVEEEGVECGVDDVGGVVPVPLQFDNGSMYC
jgi:hypothetical protein